MGEEREISPEKQAAEAGGRQRVNGEWTSLVVQKRSPMLISPFTPLKALLGSSKPVANAGDKAQSDPEEVHKAPKQKTAAAQELEEMLKEADEEDGRKVSTIVLPIESRLRVCIDHSV